jgi:hypothetical protein
MNMLISIDVLSIITLAVGVGILLAGSRRPSHVNPLVLLFAGLAAEMVCATVASERLRCTEWEPYVRAAGRILAWASIVNLLWYIRPSRPAGEIAPLKETP